MHKYCESILGTSPATLIRGIRFGLRDTYHSGRSGFSAARPWENPQLKGIPTIALDDLMGSKNSAIKLRVMKYEDGMLPLCDAIPLLAILVMEQPGKILEIGTYMGHTTRLMAENLPESIIHTVDLPVDFSVDKPSDSILPKDDFHLIRKRIVGREFKNQACESRIIQHFGDTATFDFKKAGDPACFFIDGAHTYEYCKSDSEKCFDLCAGKGLFFWHDCDQLHPGVARFVSEWRAAGRNIIRIEGTALAYWKSL